MTNNASDNLKVTYNTYLDESLECFNNISAYSKRINFTQENFTEELRFLKKAYRTRSTESDKEKDKLTFGQKIREFFLKMWGFFVKIFTMIADAVINLIKSIIIYISKRKLQRDALYKLVHDNGVLNDKKVLDEINPKITNRAGKKLKVVAYGANILSHNEIIKRLRSTQIKRFVELPISYDNKNSPQNIESLKKLFASIVAEKQGDLNDASTNNLANLGQVIDNMYINGVLKNEMNLPKEGYNKDIISKDYQDIFSIDNMGSYEEIVHEGKIDKLANLLVFGTPEKKIKDVTLADYFGLTSTDDLKYAFKEYIDISNVTFENIDKLETVLKEYHKQSKKDKKGIEEISKLIISEINKYVNSNAPEANYKISKYNEYTKIVNKVRRMKTHFVRIRQSVIINLITLMNVEHKAWEILTKNTKYIDVTINETTIDDGETA